MKTTKKVAMMIIIVMVLVPVVVVIKAFEVEKVENHPNHLVLYAPKHQNQQP